MDLITRTWEGFYFVHSAKYSVLQNGIPARMVEITEDEWEVFRTFRLITAKPMMFICNVTVMF